jgi:hypothetical protein
MARRAMKRWWTILLVALGIPLASAATVSVTTGTLGAGVGTPATCDSGAPTVAQNVGTLTNATNIVSVDVSGIAAACGNGTVQVAVYNNTDAVQQASKAIPASGGTVNVPLGTPVALKDAHLVAVILQGP